MKKMIDRLQQLFLFGLLFAVGHLDAAYSPQVYDRGNARVFEVMYQGPGGIDAVNKKILFAETKNLSQDLNLQEMSHRFGCKTELGKAFLKFHLEKPISPFDRSSTVEHRQKLIRFFVDNPDLQEKMDALIGQVAEHEKTFMEFMKERSVQTSSENPLVSFLRWKDRNKYVQSYVKTIEANYLVDGAGKVLKPVVNQGVNLWNFTISDLSATERIVLFASGLVTGLKNVAVGSITSLLPIWLRDDKTVTEDNLYLMNAYMAAVAGYSMYTHYAGALESRNALHSLYRLVDIAKEIESLCSAHDIEHQFKVSSIRSRAGLDLLEELNQDRYKDKDSNFIYSIAVNSFKYDVYENDAALAPVYASIAEMDAYLALARKISSQQTADNKFCFAEFLDNSKPKIETKGFWNILVSKGSVVTNDLSEDRNIILTGANEGGKTTTIRAILQNIVLAQTFGIAAATEFKIAPYAMIHSYLNVSDDILSGKSRYAFELAQAKNILDQIESLSVDSNFFFVLDELFTGTNGEDGAEAAYRFIDNIASFPGIQFIYATHFNKLKEIGAANPACANYKIEPPLSNNKGEFIRDDKGEFIYPYKLSPGANSVNVALERAIDAGIFRKKMKKNA
ncbi:hypothetical protein KBC04_05500 [Candidatus Babeliales bacterium]|nr:hypothetical protein [Candidatus Babeliales bacterium]MBP9844263.1 hypothetical protein [Candidatus Babeliales bacterium]